ncbi:MAG: T9SS type A sorting domain-containing protein [Crocinitomicaceae bacterium]
MKKVLFISALICSGSLLNANAQTNNTFFLGHSLINFNVPNMVNQLSIASTETFSYDANIGNGATLNWHWTNPATGQGEQWDLTLPNGGYENFIFTEAVPLQNHLSYSDTYRYADSLCSFADQYNPNIQYYMYETWHCIYSGNGSTSGAGGYPCDWDPESVTPWRDRIDIDLAKWESIADSINLIHTNPMLIIPGGQALGRLADSIEAGAVPGLTDIFDLFTDFHHLDNRGNYFIACVMYSVIHGTSPQGLPNQLTNDSGTLYSIHPTPEQAAIMQEIAWQTVCDYPRDGVSCSLDVSVSTIDKAQFTIYPVPVSNELTIQYDALEGSEEYLIRDGVGKVVLTGNLTSSISTVQVSALSSGVYFVCIKDQVVKFIK